MDTIDVAIKKGSEVLGVLVFSEKNTDAEIQTFAEQLGGDSFHKLGEYEVVENGAIITKEKPHDNFVWDKAGKTWKLPAELLATVIPPEGEF